MHCQFEAYLDDALRDRLVCGLRKESTQKWLLLKERLTFTKAVTVAQSTESVDKQTLAMKNDMSEQSKVVHHVSSSGPCTRCGKSNHVPSHCPYKGFKRLKCGKQGHLKVVRHSKAGADPGF